MKAAGIPHEKRRPPSVGRRCRPTRFAEKARSRGFSIDGCVNDAIGRRTSMSRSGSAYATPDTISYTYNDRSELTGAQSNVDTIYSYSYAYDPIGNRITASEAGVPWTYTTNSLNQYTSATENNVQMDFSYDLDGSMTYRPVDATSGWTQVWNAENRMVETNKGTDRLTFKYDYMGRRVEKCVYFGNALNSRTLFVYDGFKCVEELDALDGNAVTMRHAWQPFDVGLDVILATTDGNGASCFLHDANKNVMQKADASGTVQDTCVYAPFGRTLSINNDHFGFSSESIDNEQEVTYYNYRYFAMEMGRWIKRDIVKEINNGNMYIMVGNNPIVFLDILGLFENSESNLVFYEYQMYLIEMKRRQLEQQFMDWYNNELKNMGWINELTPCPPKLAEKYEERPITESLDYLMWYSTPNRETAIWPSSFQKHVGWQNPDEDEWAFSSRDSIFCGFYWVGPIYHPGGYYELRTKNPGDSKAGNQCVYDKCGNLILDIPSAGTADRISPNADFDNHQTMDVKPYGLAKQLGSKFIELYYRVRPHIYYDKYGNKHINSKIVY